jgi:hypothetical protein
MPLPFFGRKVDPEARQGVLDYYRAVSAVVAYQDAEAGRYNAVLGNHIASLDDAASQEAVLRAVAALCEADKEAIRRHNALTVPDLAVKDWAEWNVLFMKHLEWVEASQAAFEALHRGAGLPTTRVQVLLADAEAQRVKAEKASRDLLRAIRIKPSEAMDILRSTQV